jgi:hypothetical protein
MEIGSILNDEPSVTLVEARVRLSPSITINHSLASASRMIPPASAFRHPVSQSGTGAFQYRPTFRHLKWGTPCTSILLAGERDTPCTSILLVVEWKNARQYYWRWKRIHHACPYGWLRKWIHPARPYSWLWKWLHPARPFCWLWKGIHLHVHSAGSRRDDTLHISTTGDGKGYTMHVQLSIRLAAEIDTPCTSVVNTAGSGKGRRPTRPYCQLYIGIHPARPF